MREVPVGLGWRGNRRILDELTGLGIRREALLRWSSHHDIYWILEAFLCFLDEWILTLTTSRHGNDPMHPKLWADCSSPEC